MGVAVWCCQEGTFFDNWLCLFCNSKVLATGQKTICEKDRVVAATRSVELLNQNAPVFAEEIFWKSG